jgi:hypothetical protein
VEQLPDSLNGIKDTNGLFRIELQVRNFGQNKCRQLINRECVAKSVIPTC